MSRRHAEAYFQQTYIELTLKATAASHCDAVSRIFDKQTMLRHYQYNIATTLKRFAAKVHLQVSLVFSEINKHGLTVHKAEEQLVLIVRVELEVTRSIVVCLIERCFLQPTMREKFAKLYAALQAKVSEIDSIFDNIAWAEN